MSWEIGDLRAGVYRACDMKVKAGILVMKGLSRDASRDKKMGKGVWGRVNHNSGSMETP